MKPGATGIQRVFDATKYSIKGFKAAYQHEAAFRQELLLLIIAIPLAFILTHGALERVLLISSVMIILLVELLNSAIEAVVDRVGSELHELSGRAKDIASAAVFVALANAAITWALIIFA